jgi:hypothetical protein
MLKSKAGSNTLLITGFILGVTEVESEYQLLPTLVTA